MRQSFSAIAATLAAACAACSDAPADTDGTVTPEAVNADNGAALLNDAFCDFLVRCQSVPLDKATCLKVLRSSARSTFDRPESAFAAVKAGRATLDAAKAKRCIDAVRAAACNAADPMGAEPACAEAFAGKVPVGGACTGAVDCIRGADCVQSADTADSACKATCVALQPGACRDTRDCDNGRICRDKQCVTPRPPGGAGEACGMVATCQAGLVCTGNDRCEALPGEGQPCSGECAPGFVCDAGPNAKCLALRTKGEDCTGRFQCGGALSKLVCDRGSATATDKCVDRPATGPCVNGVCDQDVAYCDQSGGTPTCKPLRALGAPCEHPLQCGPPFGDADCPASGPDAFKCTRRPFEECAL